MSQGSQGQTAFGGRGAASWPSSSATLGDLLTAATAALAALDSPRREAQRLLAHATGLDLAALLRDRDRVVDAPGFEAMVARRAAREPLALITGRQGFWSLDLAVSADTLIPRADSESLIEAALEAFPDRAVRRVLDLGTGTGCLLLAALTEFRAAWGVGVDLAPAAAALAKRNAESLGLADRCAMLAGDWATALHGTFDLVLSNPPYIEAAAVAGLMPEVSRYEPRRALDGGPDGLAAYRRILAALPDLLAPGGVAILELGAGQEADVADLARSGGLAPGTARADLEGIPRALPVRLAAAKKPFGRPGAGR
ncbi:MAG: peptide chain release factor N(5)-glutamine methyltransferase [Acetobacteraceae bacterium]